MGVSIRACEQQQSPRIERLLAPHIGAEITGLDLSQHYGKNGAALIRELVVRHHVVLFRGQSNITPLDQLWLTRCFGRPIPHPVGSRKTMHAHPEILVLENGAGKRGPRNDVWHSDASFAERPPSVTILRAVEVPESGGDTMWCNMVRALATLPDEQRAELVHRRAVHSARLLQMRNAMAPDAPEIASIPDDVEHPVIRAHPDSGARALFVNPVFTMHFRGETWDESRPRLHRLVEHATREDNVYRHRWRAGDVMLWDNRTTMHFAHYDYDRSARRVMHRTTAEGERPV